MINSYVSILLAVIVVYPIHLSIKLRKTKEYRHISHLFILLMMCVVINGIMQLTSLTHARLPSQTVTSNPEVILFTINLIVIISLFLGVKGIASLIKTTTKQKQRIHDIQLKIGHMETIQLSAKILSSTSLMIQEKLQNILDVATKHVIAEHASIMLKNKKGELFVVAATDKSLIGIKKTIARGISSWVVKESTSLNIDNVNNDSRFNDNLLHKYKKNSFISIPIKTGDNVVGVFNINDKVDDDKFSSNDEEILMNINDKIGSFLETTKYYN